MRIYSSITIDIATGVTLAAEWEDYSGPVALCWDGTGDDDGGTGPGPNGSAGGDSGISGTGNSVGPGTDPATEAGSPGSSNVGTGPGGRGEGQGPMDGFGMSVMNMLGMQGKARASTPAGKLSAAGYSTVGWGGLLSGRTATAVTENPLSSFASLADKVSSMSTVSFGVQGTVDTPSRSIDTTQDFSVPSRMDTVEQATRAVQQQGPTTLDAMQLGAVGKKKQASAKMQGLFDGLMGRYDAMKAGIYSTDQPELEGTPTVASPYGMPTRVGYAAQVGLGLTNNISTFNPAKTYTLTPQNLATVKIGDEVDTYTEAIAASVNQRQGYKADNIAQLATVTDHALTDAMDPTVAAFATDPDTTVDTLQDFTDAQYTSLMEGVVDAFTVMTAFTNPASLLGTALMAGKYAARLGDDQLGAYAMTQMQQPGFNAFSALPAAGLAGLAMGQLKAGNLSSAKALWSARAIPQSKFPSIVARGMKVADTFGKYTSAFTSSQDAFHGGTVPGRGVATPAGGDSGDRERAEPTPIQARPVSEGSDSGARTPGGGSAARGGFSFLGGGGFGDFGGMFGARISGKSTLGEGLTDIGVMLAPDELNPLWAAQKLALKW